MDYRVAAASARWLVACVLLMLLAAKPAAGAYVWVEGEKPKKADVRRHPWWYDKVKTDQLSGGDLISNWGDKPGQLDYVFKAPAAGQYEFWVRANPVGTKLSYQINDEKWAAIDMSKAQDSINIAADGKIDLRFIAWIRAGEVKLKDGQNTIRFRMVSENNNHGMLDCFVLSSEPFQPRGILKPEGLAKEAGEEARGGKDWVTFDPPPDPLAANSAIDLRRLNEKFAGEGGFIKTRGDDFIHGDTGKLVRFWAVNGPPDLKDPKDLRRCARILAKYGVNMVRIHAPYFDENGEVDPAKIQHAIDIVEAMKAEGIYTDFSIFWYSFYLPKPNTPWLAGYDGHKAPVAVLFFNPDFQKKYESWWKALMTTPDKTTGKRLIDDPAVACLEMMNEDSLFFWTFSDGNIPDPQMRIIETDFGEWLKKKYGSLEAALKKWNGLGNPRDNLVEGRIGFRPLWNIFNERTARDQDTVAFMTDLQRRFYETFQRFFHVTLGFKGVVTGSNWTTADAKYLGPLDKFTYTACDYVDRHGYFSGVRKGPNDGWAVMNDQTFSDRSALRFDAAEPGKGKDFNNPVMDTHYDHKPSMISETAFERPNRYRSEAPLYYACYGALQDSGGIVHFALDTDRWTVKPGYFMQPWTLMSPGTMGQFPAAALIFRERLISPGDEVVNLNLRLADLEALKGTPMPQDASFDELRARDVPQGAAIKPGNVIDPLVHYVGKTNVTFSASGGPAKIADLRGLIDRKEQTVMSTTRQLKLDYRRGVLTINAPAAQGISGNLKEAGLTELKDLSIHSELPLGHIIAVSLDGKPLAASHSILLQVMSEEKNNSFGADPVSEGLWRITSIGQDPWMIRSLNGTVKLKRTDAARMKVTSLDLNGYRCKPIGTAERIALQPNVVYYLIE